MSVNTLIRISPELKGGIEGSHDVLGRDESLDIMHRGEDEAATRGQVINAPLDFIDDLLRLAKGQDMLGIYAAPKDDIPAKFLFQSFCVHAARRNLHRV